MNTIIIILIVMNIVWIVLCLMMNNDWFKEAMNMNKSWNRCCKEMNQRWTEHIMTQLNRLESEIEELRGNAE